MITRDGYDLPTTLKSKATSRSLLPVRGHLDPLGGSWLHEIKYDGGGELISALDIFVPDSLSCPLVARSGISRQ